jgi:cytochrome c biogenesis protein CcmG/thiol:disulfide interchange protein DsbE
VPDLAAFAERAGGRVGLVGVLTQDPQRNGLEFARQFGMRWPSVVDDQGEVFRAFRPGPPVTLFLDAQGRVVHKRSGKFDDVAEIEALVAEHLGVSV